MEGEGRRTCRDVVIAGLIALAAAAALFLDTRLENRAFDSFDSGHGPAGSDTVVSASADSTRTVWKRH